MRNGKCPKCESSNVHITQDDQLVEVRIGGRRQETTDYICADCGYYEANITDTPNLRQPLAASPIWKKAG